MNLRSYAAESIGTFMLALMVHLGLQSQFPVATAVLAALTLGTMVYVFGSISGTHINPSVTVGLWSVGKISARDACFYILAQCIGGAVAFIVGNVLIGSPIITPVSNLPLVYVCEAFGAAILVLGVSSVVWGKAPAPAAGLTIGSSLLLGILVASTRSNGVLNPAVAIGIGSVSLPYLVAPLVGGVIAAWGYKVVVGERL